MQDSRCGRWPGLQQQQPLSSSSPSMMASTSLCWQYVPGRVQTRRKLHKESLGHLWSEWTFPFASIRGEDAGESLGIRSSVGFFNSHMSHSVHHHQFFSSCVFILTVASSPFFVCVLEQTDFPGAHGHQWWKCGMVIPLSSFFQKPAGRN